MLPRLRYIANKKRRSNRITTPRSMAKRKPRPSRIFQLVQRRDRLVLGSDGALQHHFHARTVSVSESVAQHREEAANLVLLIVRSLPVPVCNTIKPKIDKRPKPLFQLATPHTDPQLTDADTVRQRRNAAYRASPCATVLSA